MRRLLSYLCLFAIFAGAPGRAAEPLTRLAGGESFSGRVTGVDRQWRITIQTAGGPRSVPAGDLVRWGAPVEPPARTWVLLDDGGLVVADLLAVNAEHVEVDSDLLGTLKLPSRHVAAIVFRPPSAPADQDALVDRLIARPATDRLLLVNGDELRGAIERVAGDKARMRGDMGPIDVELRKLRGLSFGKRSDSPLSPTDLRVWIGLRDGSRLLARGLELADGKLRIDLAGSVTVQTTADELIWLQPMGGRVVYLSDQPVSGYRHVPYLDLVWPYRVDRNVTGSRLSCRGQRYLKGLGVHSAARLTYQLTEPYDRFEAELGIDDVTSGGGSVRFRLFVNGQQRYASDVIRGNQGPMPISVDIRGAKRLDLIVDYADRADQLDHADWLEARVTKPQ